MADASADAARAVNDLADRFWQSVLALNPVVATFHGDQRYADRLEDPGPDGRAEARRLLEGTLADVAAIREPLSVEDGITLELLRVIAELGVQEDDLALHQLRVVDHINGPQTLLPQVALVQPVATPEQLEAFLARLRGYPAYLAANMEILRDGMTSGLTASRVVTERTIAQLERALGTPVAQSAIPTVAGIASDDDRRRVLEAVRAYVYPAEAAFLELLAGEYLPATREEPGLWSAPDGDALYRMQIKSSTTLDLDPGDLHRIGLEELEAIEAARRAIARGAGFGDDTRAYRTALRNYAANIPLSVDDLLRRAAEDVERARVAASSVFGRLPATPCEVRAVEAFRERDSPFAYYVPPADDGSRAGTYYVNTWDLDARRYATLAPATYHEAIPGHHLQLALETENRALGAFRRLGAGVVGGAHVEGWGLYAERLADELGLYRNEAERFGMLDVEALRAARLVVDTGLHGLRWDRRRAIDFLVEVGVPETDAVIETDRYICWPGQALAYKVGQREIVRLRRALEDRDGRAFDLRRFHDEVIGHGPLPLAILARELPAWVSPRARG